MPAPVILYLTYEEAEIARTAFRRAWTDAKLGTREEGVLNALVLVIDWKITAATPSHDAKVDRLLDLNDPPYPRSDEREE